MNFIPEPRFESFEKREATCMSAVRTHFATLMPQIEAAAERVAVALGAAWLRVDFLLPEKGAPGAPEGFVMHSISSIATSTATWAGRSQRAAAVVAEGFQVRIKLEDEAIMRQKKTE